MLKLGTYYYVRKTNTKPGFDIFKPVYINHYQFYVVESLNFSNYEIANPKPDNYTELEGKTLIDIRNNYPEYFI